MGIIAVVLFGGVGALLLVLGLWSANRYAGRRYGWPGGGAAVGLPGALGMILLGVLLLMTVLLAFAQRVAEGG